MALWRILFEPLMGMIQHWIDSHQEIIGVEWAIPFEIHTPPVKELGNKVEIQLNQMLNPVGNNCQLRFSVMCQIPVEKLWKILM